MARRDTDHALAPGDEILGKYRVLKVLGAGGMGAVVEAENLRTSRRVAIKALQGGAKPGNAGRRFLNEARAAASLTHPNSVDVLDLDQDADGTLYIVQELLSGESLYDRLMREHKLPWREAFELAVPVMSALAEAHRKGIVHRDVKPENIFLHEAAPGLVVPKVIDFGVARFTRTDERLTRNDRVVGTPYYMSPEQASGERELDGQTDVWALGVVLYEMLSGQAAFEGQNLKQVMTDIIAGSFTPLRLRAPELPADVSAVVERAMKVDRAVRYATMGEMLDATRRRLGDRGYVWARITQAPAATDESAPPRDRSSDARATAPTPLASTAPEAPPATPPLAEAPEAPPPPSTAAAPRASSSHSLAPVSGDSARARPPKPPAYFTRLTPLAAATMFALVCAAFAGGVLVTLHAHEDAATTAHAVVRPSQSPRVCPPPPTCPPAPACAPATTVSAPVPAVVPPNVTAPPDATPARRRPRTPRTPPRHTPR